MNFLMLAIVLMNRNAVATSNCAAFIAYDVSRSYLSGRYYKLVTSETEYRFRARIFEDSIIISRSSTNGFSRKYSV